MAGPATSGLAGKIGVHRIPADSEPRSASRGGRRPPPRILGLFKEVRCQEKERSCLGVIRLGGRHGPERLEAAARRALATGCVSYRSLDSILRRRLDREPAAAPPATPPAAEHVNLRGPGCYQ